MSNAVVEMLGEQAEFGGGGTQRILLPESYYAMKITLGDDGVSDERDEIIEDKVTDENGEEVLIPFLDVAGEAVPAGGSPWVQLHLEVADGPFEGVSYSERAYLTPGKGKFIGYISNMARCIAGVQVNHAVMDEFGMEFPTGLDKGATQQAFRKYFYSMDPEKRKDFMFAFLNLGKWDGKVAVTKVGHEEGNRARDDGSIPVFNRSKGWYATNDPKHGLAWVKKTCYKGQQEEHDALGIEVA